MMNKLKEIEDAPWTTERVFALFDVDGDGNLDRDEIKTAITAISEQVPQPEAISYLFTKYDTNGDGQFDRAELEKMLKDDILKRRKRRKSAFGQKKVDRNDLEDKETVRLLKEEVRGGAKLQVGKHRYRTCFNAMNTTPQLVAKELLLEIDKDAQAAKKMAKDADQKLKDSEASVLAAKMEEEKAKEEVSGSESQRTCLLSVSRSGV